MLNKTDVRQSPSVCPLDCPDTCSLVVDVAGDSIVRVRGSTSNPLTEGVICEKVAKYYPDFVHGKRRLKQPLKRTGERGGNDFKAISWPEALDLTFEGINSSIERFGPESVLPLNYAGPHGQLSGGSMDLRFFHRMGATLLNRSPLCGGVRSTAYGSLFGQAPGISPEQALHSDLIIVWGTNITVSNLHFMRIIKTAKKRGAKLVVIDPKRIKASRQADLYLQVHPGSDVVLGMAMAAEFERRGMIDQSFVTRNVHGYDAYMEAARRYTLDDARNQCRIGDNSVETFIQLYT